MKKINHGLLLTALLFGNVLLCRSIGDDPNLRTGWPSPYPFAKKIINETFQSWPNQRTYSSDPIKCNDNNRTSNFNWQNTRINLFSPTTECKINVYLVSAEIQPFCDTQSGTTYSSGDTTITPNTTKLGPTNIGVSLGSITLYDSTTLFPKDPATGVTFRKGAIIIGQLPYINLIQYTTSSFGAKRGFTLEYSLDHGKTWTVIRREHGKSNDTTMTTCGYQLYNSPKGVIWEENIELTNAMLRFTINANQPQLVRIHDLRIFAPTLLREDLDDSQFEANYGITWGDWVGVNAPKSYPTILSYAGNVLNISKTPEWTQILGMDGRVLETFGDEQIITLTTLPKGAYVVRTKDTDGMVHRLKICRN